MGHVIQPRALFATPVALWCIPVVTVWCETTGMVYDLVMLTPLLLPPRTADDRGGGGEVAIGVIHE